MTVTFNKELLWEWQVHAISKWDVRVGKASWDMVWHDVLDSHQNLSERNQSNASPHLNMRHPQTREIPLLSNLTRLVHFPRLLYWLECDKEIRFRSPSHHLLNRILWLCKTCPRDDQYLPWMPRSFLLHLELRLCRRSDAKLYLRRKENFQDTVYNWTQSRKRIQF